MDPEERLERLSMILAELREANESVPILVEGRRDERALRNLGCRGEIRMYNSGKTLADVAESIARAKRRVILLLDWDRTGGHLVRRLAEYLHAQVELDLDYRRQLAQVSGVRCVEELPAALRALRRKIGLDSEE